MLRTVRYLRILISATLILAFWLTPLSANAQDLLAVSSITGGSSVFVFRNSAKAPRRFVPAPKTVRTQAQRVETAAKIKKQYETLAKVNPRREVAKVVEPNKIPPGAERTMPAAQVSKLFAGVGEYYLQKGDYTQSFDFFRDAIRLDETNTSAKSGFSEALSSQGNDLLAKDQAGTAKAIFLEALKYNPNNSAAYFGLGEAYTELNETASAIANYENALVNNKDLTEIYVPLGILYFQTGEIAKADDLLSKALKDSAETAETQFFIGLIRVAQNRTEDALAAFQRVKTLDPTNAEAFFQSAEALTKLKKLDLAIADYQKAVDLKPNHFDAWLGLGDTYSELGKYPEAINAYAAAKKLKNNDWSVYAGIAEAYRQTNKFEEAESNYRLAVLFYMQTKDFDKAKAADFYSKMAYMVGQQCEIDTRNNVQCKWPSAIKALQNAVDQTGDPIDLVNLGWSYFRSAHGEAEAKNMEAARPKLELAKAALEKAVATGGTAEEFGLQNLAAVQIDLGDNQGAIATLNRLIPKRPDQNFLRYYVGVAYYKENDLANAEKWFRAALEKEPANAGYLNALGNTLLGRKNGKELLKVIEKLRTVDPGSAESLDLRRKALRL
ncbi:hypothetical protein BH10ACI2_BH10ACI2_20680 [soil metagenome]